MARVRLEHDEVEEGRLPSVCMCCGAPATLQKNKNFSWHPPWVAVLLLAGLLPYAIVAIVLTKRMTVAVPLCQSHKGHWAIRLAVTLGGLVLILVLIFAGIALTSNPQGRGGNDLGGLVCLGGAVAVLVWLVLIIVLQYTSIRPAEITDRSITLAGVSPAFVEALEEHRLHDETGRRRAYGQGPWRAEAREHFDPRARRPGREPPDAIRED